MKKKLFYIGVLSCAITACADQASTSPMGQSQPPVLAATIGVEVQAVFSKAPICYVLCDFSNSQDANSQGDIASNAKEIFKQMRSRYAMAYININAPQLQKAFFQYVPPETKEIETPRERRQRQDAMNQQAATLAQRLNELGQGEKANQTCIIKALNKVADELAISDQNKTRPVRIIVLSDMLEVCTNDFGPINLEKPPYQKAIQALEKMKPPPFGFNQYNDLKIGITASSGKSGIPISDLLGFWKEVFAKYGYTLEKPIAAVLPDWVSE
jgi:hypothetical protein